MSEPCAAILLYHSIAVREQDHWRLAVTPDRFAQQMSRLAERFRPMSARELVGRREAGTLTPRAVAVTFDDGYRDNLTVALPILREHGLPATFFISGAGAMVGESFWWERLEAAARRRGLTGQEVSALHAELLSATAEERSQRLEALADVPASDLPLRMTAEELAQLAATPGVEIGAHGWSHKALGSIPEDEQRREIADNVTLLRKSTGQPVDLFAYPFGGPYTEATVRLLREAGIRAAFTVRPAPVAETDSLWSLPRLEVGDWEGGELEERLEAWFGTSVAREPGAT